MADNKSPDEDFTGLVEDWDDRVFRHAEHFRVHRFSGRGGQDRVQTTEFPIAMRAAIDALRAGYRVLVYAVTATGRYQALEQRRWNHYATIYLENKDGHEAKIGRPAPVVRDKRHPRRSNEVGAGVRRPVGKRSKSKGK